MSDPTIAGWIGAHLADRYRLDRLLGQGGMGAVFEAFDLTLQRVVAVKVILPERATNGESVARFLREARSAAALSHPGITTVHDVGRAPTPNGMIPYLVMERLRGETLAERLTRGPLTTEQARTLAIALLDALAVAHEAGVVHRDLKPDNVFLRAPNGTPTILDFGIATMIEGANAGPNLTREGQSLGTPLYMAPEQLGGERVGPRADLYAIGALLYEAVTGLPTYQADTFTALVAAKLTTNPNPRMLIAMIGDGTFARTVLSALARDPELRPSDARTMAEALARTSSIDELASTASHDSAPPVAKPAPAAQSGAAVSPAITTTGTGSSPGGRRARIAVVAITGSLAIGATVSLGLAHRDRTPPLPQGRPQHETPETPATSRPGPTVALGVLRQLREASGARRSLLESPEMWEQCADDFAIAVDRPDAPLRWRAGLELCRGYAKLLRADATGALPIVERAAVLDPTWPEAQLPLADALVAVGRTDEAIAALRTALRLDPGWWLPSSKLGSVYARGENYPEAIQAYRRAREAAPTESRILDSLALTYHAAEMDELADETATEAIALDPGAPWAQLIRAERALERGEGDAALTSAEHTLATFPSSPVAVLARADALTLLHRDDVARRAYAQLLALVGDASEESTGLPPGRLALVRDALARERLPTPRHRVRSSSGTTPGRSSPPSTRSRPSGGSGSRSRPDDPLSGIDF